ncbi:hypothetical protein ALC56_13677 [Trachymyrmex septentrionalis]|uniref:Uncharacterized protein n=1 Tax=Trachymyrmex septentrionalis TaxID=34720 RepID=A0A195EVK9_9HYME|nr:hypothetical protein ALC56_13677 [Trachymyrmex septentrionalis]
MDSGQTGERKGPTVGEASLLSQGAPPEDSAGERRGDHNTAEILGEPRHIARQSWARYEARCCYVIGQAYWAFVSLGIRPRYYRDYSSR